MSRLTGETYGLLHKEIVEAFIANELEHLIRVKLNVRLDTVVAPGSLNAVVDELISYHDRREEVAKLVEAVIQERPNLRGRLASITAGTLPVVPIGRGLFQLPPRLRDFTGREDELKQITTRLRGAGADGTSLALRGMGGLGKTKTAIEACWRVRDQFPDAQLFIELRGMSERPTTAAEAMARVIRDFRPEVGKLPDTEAELLPLYQNVLRG
jgi:hypothetical protein